MTTRRSLLAGALATLAAPALVRAQAREIVVGGPGGLATAFRDDIIPDFQRRTNGRVLYEGSRSVVNLQKLQTGRAAPTMSVVIMDEDIMMVAADEGLTTPVTPAQVPEMARIYPATIARDGLWLRHSTPRIAIGLNTQRVPGGISSWAEMWEPRWRGHLAFPHMSLTSTACVLTVAAHLETGKPFAEAQYDVEAGFRKLRALKPNIFAFFNNGQQGQTLMEQGEAWAIPGTITSTVLSRKIEGVPVDLATPREGSFGLPGCIALVKNGPNAEYAHQFINEVLSVRVQTIWATRYFDSPANPGVNLGPAVMPADRLFTTDWPFVARNRAAWIERFDREIVA